MISHPVSSLPCNLNIDQIGFYQPYLGCSIKPYVVELTRPELQNGTLLYKNKLVLFKSSSTNLLETCRKYLLCCCFDGLTPTIMIGLGHIN